MADPAPQQAAEPQMTIVAQFVRDLSFENPGAGRRIESRPELPVRLDANARRVSEDIYEVTLKIEAGANADSKPIYVVSLDYVGVFRLTGAPEGLLEAILLVECPRLMFPFARRILSDVTRDGGYPPLLLDPVDFMAMYRQRLEAAQQKPAGTA